MEKEGWNDPAGSYFTRTRACTHVLFSVFVFCSLFFGIIYLLLSFRASRQKFGCKRALTASPFPPLSLSSRQNTHPLGLRRSPSPNPPAPLLISLSGRQEGSVTRLFPRRAVITRWQKKRVESNQMGGLKNGKDRTTKWGNPPPPGPASRGASITRSKTRGSRSATHTLSPYVTHRKTG